MTFYEILAQHREDPSKLRAALQRHLGFPQGFWHPEDLDGALDVVRGCLADLGLDADLLTAAVLEQTKGLLANIETDEGEDAARRHQIGHVVRHVNSVLPEPPKARFRAFGDAEPGWESGEPVWLLVSAEQCGLLLESRIARAAPALEASYDPK